MSAARGPNNNARQDEPFDEQLLGPVSDREQQEGYTIEALEPPAARPSPVHTPTPPHGHHVSSSSLNVVSSPIAEDESRAGGAGGLEAQQAEVEPKTSTSPLRGVGTPGVRRKPWYRQTKWRIVCGVVAFLVIGAIVGGVVGGVVGGNNNNDDNGGGSSTTTIAGGPAPTQVNPGGATGSTTGGGGGTPTPTAPNPGGAVITSSSNRNTSSDVPQRRSPLAAFLRPPDRLHHHQQL